MDVLITNNPLVEARYSNRFEVVFLNTGLLGILTRVRDYVHKGHVLLTHPLSGSVKPNETIYKSVLLSAVTTNVETQLKAVSQTPVGLQPETGPWPQTDFQSVSIIEESISAVRKFPQKHIPEEYLPDLQTVDLALIKSALETHNGYV